MNCNVCLKGETTLAELEQTIEQKLIEQLTQGKSQWTYRPDLDDESKLWENIRTILDELPPIKIYKKM